MGRDDEEMPIKRKPISWKAIRNVVSIIRLCMKRSDACFVDTTKGSGTQDFTTRPCYFCARRQKKSGAWMFLERGPRTSEKNGMTN